MRNRQQLRQLGFTIVEILVVIVVISILVAIAVVSYGNYQEKARDAERRSDLQQIASAIKNYANWKNTQIEVGSNCGSGGNGSGWFNASSADVGATYATNSIADCLATAGYLKSAKDTIDPTGCKAGTGGACGSSSSLPVRAYMKTTCTVGGVKTTYIMAALETQSANNAVIDPLCGRSWGTSFGMNYYVTVR